MKREKQEQLQKKSVELIKEKDRLILQWCTGLGKSKAAIDIIKELRPKRILLVVAEIAHKGNWKEEFLKWHLSDTGVVMETYASLKNHRGEHYDLLILDEGHHVGSELRLDIISDVGADKVLVLSATLPNEVVHDLTVVYGEFANYKVTLKQAIDWGILPEPKIYLIPMELDNTYKVHTVIESWGKKAKRKVAHCDMQSRWTYMKDKVKYPDMELQINCTAKEKCDWYDNKSEYFKKLFFRTRNEGIKNKWLQLGSARKRFLGDLKSTDAQYLIGLLKRKKKRFVCFCSSITQADLLGGNNSIHSEKKDSLEIIDKFNAKKISDLFAVGMIQEGQNLTDIDAGVIIQLDGGERAFIQKSGRAMRAEEPTLYILYFKGTRDEEYLSNVLDNMEAEYITEVNNLYDLEV